MVITAGFKYTNFALKESGANVDVYSFGLSLTGAFDTPTEPQEIELTSTNSPEGKHENLEIRCRRVYLNHSKTVNIHLEFILPRSYDSVEIRSINFTDESERDTVQKLEDINCDTWYNFAVIRAITNDTMYYEFYCKRPIVSKISEDLYNLMKSELFSDIIIVSSDGKNFNVHKNILAAKSDVFKAHLVHNTQENTDGKIHSTFDAEVLTELLCYIYSEEVNNLDSVAERLIVAADFYKLLDLVSICELHLCKNLDVDNAIDMYILADFHSVSVLKMYALRFIQIHRKTIAQSEAFAILEPTRLMKELLLSLLQEN